MGEKLTKPQVKLLSAIAVCPYFVSWTYAPAKRLAALSLAVMGEQKWGRFKISITDAGRDALARHEGTEIDHGSL